MAKVDEPSQQVAFNQKFWGERVKLRQAELDACKDPVKRRELQARLDLTKKHFLGVDTPPRTGGP
jgi:hypothetical protein